MVFEFLRHPNDQEKNIVESTIEKMSPGKKRLLKLGKTGNYVFHGSPNGDIKMLEPRRCKVENSDDSLVFATEAPEVAIFRSMISRNIFPDDDNYASLFGMRRGKLYFEVSPSVFKELNNSKEGYVYVIPKSEFKKLSKIELVLHEPIQPVEVIRVTSKDLPEGIMVMKR